jgi:hypothetical protein
VPNPWLRQTGVVTLGTAILPLMNIYVSRDSVAAGDDLDAPHGRSFSLPDGAPLGDVLSEIIQSGYLPRISGGHATWSVVSSIPLAIVAEEWPEPRLLPMIESQKKEFDCRNGLLRLHFNYHAQIDPDTVYKVFWGFRLKAF